MLGGEKMKCVTNNHVFYAFSAANQPVVRVKQGEKFVLETHDCFQGQIKTSTDLLDKLDWDHVTPATGPVFIEGTQPGDILKIDLLRVKVLNQAVVCAVPREGVLGDRVKQMETSVLKYDGNFAVFKDKLRIPLHPMVGVIGLAPESGSVPNGTPGVHGGNMDCTEIGEGTSLYLKVGVEGALFGAGDMHAVMGDGEIVVTGAETSGELTAMAQVVELPELPTPFLATSDLVITIASASTTDDAAKLCTEMMADFLTKIAGFGLNDAAMLMSLVGNLKFCQIVDPQVTVRFEFPKWVLKTYGFELNDRGNHGE
jgi:amidase